MKEQEIEFLPPRPKLECPDCHKHFTHLERCKDKDEKGRLVKRCKSCKRKQITNIFYVPYNHKSDGFIGKFSISKSERGALYRQFTSQGLSPEQAWRKVNYHSKMLRGNYWRKKGLDKIKQMKEEKERQEAIGQKKRFLEGLTNG